MKKHTYYIAYGSNLNVRQMAHRCPTARVYGVSRIPDYRLVFKALGSCAYATIEPYKGAYVPIVVWMIEERDEYCLDRYEGYPTHYEKRVLLVTVGDREVEAMVYVMSDQAIQAMPTYAYFDTVLSGYRSFALEEYVLYEALYCVKEPHCLESNTVRFYRHMRGITQEQLAVRSSVSIRSIQKYECGERLISNAQADTVLRLAESLEVPAQCLMGKIGKS